MTKISIAILLLGSFLLTACTSSTPSITLEIEEFNLGDVPIGEYNYRDGKF